jgi:signal peptidase I
VPDRAALTTLAGDVLKRGQPLRVRAHGASMRPFLRDGDVLHVRPAATAEVGIGDVICYEPWPGTLHLHRVVARDGRGFRTRGDALRYVEAVPEASVLGRVTACARGQRTWRLDTPAARRCGRLIARVAPLVARLLPAARLLVRAARAVPRG